MGVLLVIDDTASHRRPLQLWELGQQRPNLRRVLGEGTVAVAVGVRERDRFVAQTSPALVLARATTPLVSKLACGNPHKPWASCVIRGLVGAALIQRDRERLGDHVSSSLHVRAAGRDERQHRPYVPSIEHREGLRRLRLIVQQLLIAKSAETAHDS